MKIKSEWIDRMQSNEIIELTKITMPIKIGYYLKRVLSKLREESKPFFEQKQIIIDKHKTSESNGNIHIGNMAAYLLELNELHQQEIDMPIEAIKVNIDDLPDLSVTQIEFIEPFINISEE